MNKELWGMGRTVIVAVGVIICATLALLKGVIDAEHWVTVVTVVYGASVAGTKIKDVATALFEKWKTKEL